LTDRRIAPSQAATFRRTRPDDAAELFRVRTSVHENHETEEELATLGITRESVARMLESDDACGWCAELDERIVGFAIARRSERDLFALFVEPGFEGRGLGSTLLDSAVEWLSERGTEELRLTTERGTQAQAFYLKRGWADIGTPSTEVVMLERACRPISGTD
jgi:GNAT superfamily N-acetyltransferase